MMAQEYDTNIENWANSIIELEESNDHSQSFDDTKISVENKVALVSLSMPTYYRSKAFSSHIGINSLINAADPILIVVTRLRKIMISPDLAILHQNICHEIKAFENKAQTLGYRSPLILAARYVLCALLDELIVITLQLDVQWKKYSLVETFYKDMWKEDRFFLILERSLQDTASHIDLLEFIYICLRLGYEGKYRGMERGHLEIRNITTHLYTAINQHYDESSRGLLISLEKRNYPHAKHKHYFHLLPSIWIISTLTTTILLVLFMFFYLTLTDVAEPITMFLNALQSEGHK
jgi:type VI secretion system protein ImpK